MIVTITAKAERDLEEIGDYIAQDNPQRALSFLIELRDKCLSLADMPYGFPLVPRYERYGIRHRMDGNYLIFYRADESHVTIIHVLHGAMDFATILFDTD